jgi:hypothetical protein
MTTITTYESDEQHDAIHDEFFSLDYSDESSSFLTITDGEISNVSPSL